MQVEEQQPEADKREKREGGEREKERRAMYYLGVLEDGRRATDWRDRFAALVLRSVVPIGFSESRDRSEGESVVEGRRIGCCMLPSSRTGLRARTQPASQPATGEIGYYRRRAVSAFLVTG